MSAHGVGQNIGFVVWESKYSELLEENKELKKENEQLREESEELTMNVHKVAGYVKKVLHDEKLLHDSLDSYEVIEYGVSLLKARLHYKQKYIDDLESDREIVNHDLYELMKRTGIIDKDEAITPKEEAMIYENWEWNDVADVLAKIEDRMTIRDVVVHKDQSVNTITDKDKKKYLQTLELPEDTNVDSEEGWNAVRKAFKRLAKKFHPDNKEGDTEKFKEINTAYIHLKKLHEQKNPARFVGSITCNSHARPMDLSTALHIFNTFMQSEAQQERRATGNPYFIKRSI